jgi:hypothetical protein
VVTSIPFVSRTRATFRSAEFGFFGVEVYTRVQTPRFCGQLLSAGLDVFQRGGFRPLRTSWLNVGTNFLSFYSGPAIPTLRIAAQFHIAPESANRIAGVLKTDSGAIDPQKNRAKKTASDRIKRGCFRQAHDNTGDTG